jgi:uncharacterized protein (DUF2147 family)
MKLLTTLAALIFLSSSITAQNKADDIAGIWLTNGDDQAKIQIYKSGDKFYGKIIWLKNPLLSNGSPKVDKNNPDKTKRTNPIIGLALLSGFKFNNDDAWKGGVIYDPQNGKTYSCNISLKDKNTLKVRGYIGISLLGRTEVWTRSN